MESSAASAGRATDHIGSPLLGAVSVLVGRTREQALLRETLAVAAGGRGRLVLVGGEAGIGKTSLARDVSQVAEAAGCHVLTGSCYDLTNTPPYGLWLDLFEGCRRNQNLPVPPAAFAGGRLATITDQAALFAEVRQFLSALTASGPALILLEDLHWADPASIDLLRHIGSHLRHSPLLLLVTYRSDELTRGHPLAQQLPALIREGHGLRVDLHRLDSDALRALVTNQYTLVAGDEARLVAYLERHAEGNPFFSTELLRTLEEGALLIPDGDYWSLGALDRVLVPPLLRQVIDVRIARLGEQTRKPLAMAAVIGQEVPIALWAHVAGLNDEGLLDVMERAVDAHLLEAERDGTRVRFVHALTREALYEGILPPRRRAWHRHVAEALLEDRDPDPDALAHHLQQSGDPRAWIWLVQAGDRAQRSYAWQTASDRLRAATRLLDGIDAEAVTRAQLLFRLGHLARFSDATGAISTCVAAEHLAERIGDSVLAAEARHARGIFLCYEDHFRAGLVAMVEGIEALEAMPQDEVSVLVDIRSLFVATTAGGVSNPLPQDELAATCLRVAGLHWLRYGPVWFGALAGQSRESLTAGEHFLAILASESSWSDNVRWTTAFADHGLGIAYAAFGRPDDAQRAWGRSRAKFLDLGHHVLVAFSLGNELWDRIYPFSPNDPGVRRRFATEAVAALERAGGALAPGLSPRLGWLSCLVLDGRWSEAREILRDLPAPGNNCLRREITGPHATIARHCGDAETAWRQIRPLFPQGSDTEPGDLIHQEGLLLQRLAADLSLDAGDLPGARAWLEAHDAWLAWGGAKLGYAAGRLAWARWHQAAGDSARAETAALEALDLAEEPRQPLICLASHRLLGEMAIRARNHEAAAEHLTTALNLAVICETPFERALTLLAQAELRLEMGDTAEAAQLLDDVRACCARLGAAPTLARVDALGERLDTVLLAAIQTTGLTQREQDVLRLLGAGRSNQAIADELFITRDTARTHVANIFRKLDVRTRAEAVDHAHRRGLLALKSIPST